MSYPPLPSNGEINWGTKFTTWADAIESGKVAGPGMSLRRDTTVGTRVLLDYPGGTTMLYGDTGWRDVSGLTMNGWTSSNLRIRRTEHEVCLIGIVTGTDVTSDHFMPTITGFQARTGLPLGFAANATTRTTHAILRSTPTLYISGGSGGGIYYIEAAWTPYEDWPTTLPGTPLA